MKFTILCILFCATSSLCLQANTSYCVRSGEIELITSDKEATNGFYVHNSRIKLDIDECSSCTISLKLQSHNEQKGKILYIDRTEPGDIRTQCYTVFYKFTSCFNLSATTDFKATGENESFWAIVHKSLENVHPATLSREIVIYNAKSYWFCEELYCKPSNDVSFLYLFLLIPVVFLGGAIFLFWRRRKIKTKCVNNLSGETMELIEDGANKSVVKPTEKKWPPIKINDFGDYMRDVLEANRKYRYCCIQNQFSDLPSGLVKSVKEATKQKNADKNRCNTIYPYDKNRVKLDRTSAGKYFKGDYINASYVQGSTNYKEYIIAQNPRTNTVNDFWIMIWQERISYCVMITNEHETYLRYWPTLTEKSVTFADLDIVLLERLDYRFFQKYKLAVSRKGQTREICVLHYHSWQDYDMILSKKKLLPFISFLQSIPHYSAPVLFHCREGTGRCGSVVLCDMVLRSLPVTGMVDIFHTAMVLMKSRVNAISNLEQYILVHWIIRDFLGKFY